MTVNQDDKNRGQQHIRRSMKIFRARKSDANKRTETIAIRVSPTERETLFRNADQEHDYPSNYLRKIILKHVDEIAQADEVAQADNSGNIRSGTQPLNDKR